jgi:hypothetical protein
MSSLSKSLKQRVSAFLTESGAPPRAELARNYDQLCVMMQRRHEDDAFWLRLTALVRDLVDSVVKSKNPNAPLPPEAKFLALWDVNELAQLLRAALPQEPQLEAGAGESSPNTQWFQRSLGLSPNALGLLLLLSMAASACNSSDSKTGASATGATAGSVAAGGASSSSSSLTSGGNTGQGGATFGSSKTGGTNGLGGNGGTAPGTGGSVAVGGTPGNGGAGVGGSPGIGGDADSGGATTSSVTGGTDHGGGTDGLGGHAGTVSTIKGGTSQTGGTNGLGGHAGTVSTNTGGGVGLGGRTGTVGNSGGHAGTAGAALTCQREGGAAGSTAIAGYTLPPSCCVDTASALWQAIDGSTLSTSQKQSLYACFVNLNATWCDGLVDLFKTATPQVIAQSLSELLTCCQYLPGKLNGDFATVRQDLVNRMICSVALYKGVTFPS